MKITVDLPDEDLRDICRITGLKKKGPAIRKLVEDALQLERRKEISQKFVSGEWGVELDGHEQSKAAERQKTQARDDAWRS